MQKSIPALISVILAVLALVPTVSAAAEATDSRHLDFKQHGATGDGATDDGAVISARLHAALWRGDEEDDCARFEGLGSGCFGVVAHAMG